MCETLQMPMVGESSTFAIGGGSILNPRVPESQLNITRRAAEKSLDCSFDFGGANPYHPYFSGSL
jgi:hypothetical protein